MVKALARRVGGTSELWSSTGSITVIHIPYDEVMLLLIIPTL